MKVAFFNYLMLEYGGGTARFFIDVSVGLKKRYPNLDIFIITLDKTLVKKIQKLYSFYFQRKVNKELQETDRNLKESLKKAGVIYQTVKDFVSLRKLLSNFDTVYSKNDLLEVFILNFFVGYNNLKNLVVGFHTPLFYEKTTSWQDRLHNLIYGSFFYKSLLASSHRLHVLNSFDEEKLKKIIKGKIVKKIYNPLPPMSFWQASETSASRISKQLLDSGQARVTRLLWVGRLTKEKGADDMVALIKFFNNSILSDKIRWQIVGIGKLEDEINSLAKIYKNINYFGFVENQKLKDIYSANDLFLSTSKWETFPYTFLEAQIFGLPIISYNIHGCSEIVKDKVNGYLVNSLGEYIEKLKYLINNEKEIIKKDKVKKYIRKLIDNRDIYKKLYDLLQ